MRWDCDNASSGFSGSSMMMRMSAPRPVTPHRPRLRREACAGVSNSGYLALTKDGAR